MSHVFHLMHCGNECIKLSCGHAFKNCTFIFATN